MNTDNTRLFIGYFSNKNRPRKLAGFLAQVTPELEKIWIIRKLIRFDSKSYCCCLQYPTEKSAKAAWKKLFGLQKPDKQLVLRPWVRRTGANERRDIGWRSKDWPMGERRSRERRNFQPLVYRYDQLHNADMRGRETHAVSTGPKVVSLPTPKSIGISFISEENLTSRHRRYFASI
jgi:hypothetical protein